MLRTLSLLALLVLVPVVELAAQPSPDPFGLGVERFKAKLSKKSEAKNKLLIDTGLNLPEGSVDPETDTLQLFVGGILDYEFEPSELKPSGKDKYTFKDKFAIRSGWVQLFRKGSSRGRLKLTDKGYLASGVGGLGDLETVEVRLVWGDMDSIVTLGPKVSAKGKRAKFKAGKQTYVSVELWVDAVKVKLHGGTDDDSLQLEARVTDGVGGSFDPLAADTTLRCGPLVVVVPASDWTSKGTRLTWVSPDKQVKLTYDTEREELELSAKHQDLSAQQATTTLEILSGSFHELREVVLSVNKAGTAFSY